MNTYPLKDDESFEILAASGRALRDVKLDGSFTIEDLTIRAETLLAQAEIARQQGFLQLAASLARAAELTRLPDELILRVYTWLRPKRASYEELVQLAETVEKDFQAAENGRFIREAADVYRARGLLRPA